MNRIAGMKLVLFVLCAVLLVCAGCNTLSGENYDKLKMGMSYEEVTAILGKATACDSALGARSCTWGGEQKNISVKFVADKVVFFTSKGL